MNNVHECTAVIKDPKTSKRDRIKAFFLRGHYRASSSCPRHKKAVEDYTRAINLGPCDSVREDLLNNRGFSRTLAGDFAGAQKDFRGVLRLAKKMGEQEPITGEKE